MKISAIVGSATPQRRLRSALEWLLETAFSPNGVIDLAGQHLIFGAGRSIKTHRRDAVRVTEKVVDADALVFASPVFDASVPDALSELLYHLPVEAVAGKPVGIVTMGGTQDHILAVDWQLRNVLAWSGALLAPRSVHLIADDFTSRELAEGAQHRLMDLAGTIVELLLEPRNSSVGNF